MEGQILAEMDTWLREKVVNGIWSNAKKGYSFVSMSIQASTLEGLQTHLLESMAAPTHRFN